MRHPPERHLQAGVLPGDPLSRRLGSRPPIRSVGGGVPSLIGFAFSRSALASFALGRHVRVRPPWPPWFQGRSRPMAATRVRASTSSGSRPSSAPGTRRASGSSAPPGLATATPSAPTPMDPVPRRPLRAAHQRQDHRGTALQARTIAMSDLLVKVSVSPTPRHRSTSATRTRPTSRSPRARSFWGRTLRPSGRSMGCSGPPSTGTGANRSSGDRDGRAPFPASVRPDRPGARSLSWAFGWFGRGLHRTRVLTVPGKRSTLRVD